MPATYLKLGDNAPANNVLLRANDDGTLSICTGDVGSETERYKFRTDGLLTGITKLPTLTKFLSGSSTYTTPADCVRLRVRMVGGGGGGFADVAGTAGGNTTFGTSLLVAGGGTYDGGGGTASIAAPAFGLAIKGEDGEMGRRNDPQVYWLAGGKGGNTPFGGAGFGSMDVAAGHAAANSGSGGGGGGSPNSTYYAYYGGGAGGYVEAIINNPAASYSYAVGAKGIGAPAGTHCIAGNGGEGLILIDEYYA
jgi:hypothetical protein